MNTTIGWVGLGNMGEAIVQNLLKNGCRVNVYNRTKAKEDTVVQAGAQRQENLQQLVHNSPVIVTMVTDDEAVKEVYDGLLAHAPSGKIFVDMSTVSPETSRELAQRCRDSRNEFLEAPVSGSVQPAKEGALVIMAAGERETYEKVKPLLEIMGKIDVYLGENGRGSSAKLAVNYLLGLHLQGLAETLLFADKNGVRLEDMLTVLNEGALANGITKGKGPAVLKNYFPPAFALRNLVKDLRLADSQGLQAPLFPPLLHTFQQAMASGLGEEDVMAVYRYLRANPGWHGAVDNLYPEDNVSDYAN